MLTTEGKLMGKMQVTLTVQTEIECSEVNLEEYQEKLDLLIQDLEEMDLRVDVESEVPLWEQNEE